MAPMIPKFTGSGHLRCESATGFGSCSMSLRMSVNGMTTTNMAIPSAETQLGMLTRSPTFLAESTLDVVTIGAVRRNPLIRLDSFHILQKQFLQSILSFYQRIFAPYYFHRRCELPKLRSGATSCH